MTDYKALLEALLGANVHFVVIGGLAGNAHGSPRFTQDVDIVYERTSENYEALVAALSPHNPYICAARLLVCRFAGARPPSKAASISL